jgi:AcrR family transcriptional regulator
MAASRRSRGAGRTPLSRDRVLEEAMVLADAHGVEGLTMRRLAAELGVEAMTIYYHVPNKEAILGELVERVMAEIDYPERGTEWRTALRATALSAYEVLGRHPWAPRVMLARRAPGPMRLRYMETILSLLADAGFSPMVADHAYHALEGHIMGFTLWELGMDLGSRQDLQALARAFLAQLPTETYPSVAAHIEHHLVPSRRDDQGSFAFALDLLLDGLARLEPKPGVQVMKRDAPRRGSAARRRL